MTCVKCEDTVSLNGHFAKATACSAVKFCRSMPVALLLGFIFVDNQSALIADYGGVSSRLLSNNVNVT
jgi:hypothetical protein